MNQLLLFFCGGFIVLKGFAQHCPWDCSGLILVETTVTKAMIYNLEPVLVDEVKGDRGNNVWNR